jgi:hypothetical protein
LLTCLWHLSSKAKSQQGRQRWRNFGLRYSGMHSGSVSFTLADGKTLIVAEQDLKRIYNLLWELAAEPGAVSTAALVMDVSRQSAFARLPVTLTAPQSAALGKAVAQLDAST